MALNLTKPTLTEKEINQSYRQINTYLQKMKEDGKISDETLHVIKHVCEDKGIPMNAKLYMTFSTFTRYIQDTFLSKSGVIHTKKKTGKSKETTYNNTYPDNAYRLTDKPDPNQSSIVLTSPRERRGVMIINPISTPYKPNFIASFEPLMLNVINPFLFANGNRFSKSRDWVNFPVMVVSNIGLELYLPSDYVEEWLVFDNQVSTFHFNTKPNDVERHTCFIDRSILRLCVTEELMKKQLITHGIIPHTHEVESIEVFLFRNTELSEMLMMKLNSFAVA